MSLAGVFDHGQAVALRNRDDRIEVGRPAVQVNRHDRAGALGDSVGEQLRIDISGVGADIDEDRPGSRIRDRFRRCDEGVRRRDNLVAGADPGGQQPQVESARSRIERHAVGGTAVRSELALELLDLVTKDEFGALADAVEGGEDFVPETRYWAERSK